MWPEDGIVKAELIDYSLKIAPTILRHIKGRPLSFPSASCRMTRKSRVLMLMALLIAV